MKETFDFIDRYNSIRSEFSGLRRTDMRDYPVEAVREALLNAVVHRDYSYSGSTLISIFDDRMEFVTLGGLLKGIDYDDIMLGISALRNPHLADIFYRLELIEAYGTGLLKIKETYEDCNVKPRIEVSSNAFKITLPNTNFIREQNGSCERYEHRVIYSEKEKQILQLLIKEKSLTRRELGERTDIPMTSLIRVLKQLLEKDAIRRIGGGKNTRYTSV